MVSTYLVKKNEKVVEQKIMDIFSRVSKEATKLSALSVAEEITDAYKKTVSDFYKDYKPSSYRRTYNLYSAISTYGRYGRALLDGKTIKADGGLGHIVHIEASGEYIDGHPYISYKIVGNQYSKSIASNNEVFHTTFVEGFHGTMIPFTYYIPKKMAPTPRVVMNNRFMKIKSWSKIKNLTSKNIDSIIGKIGGVING